MPSPRADFECKTCEKTYDDLPIASTRCPVCGKKRGFRRLFDRVQVSTRGHRVARFVDKRLKPAYDQKAAKDADAKRFERELAEAHAKNYELAPPEVREQLAGANAPTRGWRQAAGALSQVDPAARLDSRMYTYPQTKRHVVPQWVK